MIIFLIKTTRTSKGFYWAVPVMTFSILVGLGMDYDVFLFSRVAEYRELGFSTKVALVKGVAKTGHIITYAGVIMAIAFAGLLFSDLLMLKQFGFILSFSVLVDTFVIRTLLNPAIINLSNELTWWPRKLPILYESEALEFTDSQQIPIETEQTLLINTTH